MGIPKKGNQQYGKKTSRNPLFEVPGVCPSSSFKPLFPKR